MFKGTDAVGRRVKAAAFMLEFVRGPIGSLHRPPGNRVARGGTQGGLNCLTHALPRCLPTPTEEADGNGYIAIAGRRGPLGRRLERA